MDKIPATLTRKQVAEMLAVHPATISAWAEQGLIPFFWLPGQKERRYLRADIEALIVRVPASRAS